LLVATLTAPNWTIVFAVDILAELIGHYP